MAKRRVRNEDQQARLDAALADTFPASDPVAMLSPAPARKLPPSRPRPRPQPKPKPKRPKP
jgi:hypothetical protein